MRARVFRSVELRVDLVLAIGLAAVFVPMAIYRLIDADEGIYLANARMVMGGQMPYQDFHYPQMFLLLYVYAAWMKIAGVSWYSGRILSAILSVLLGLAVHRQAARLTGQRAWGIVAAVIFATSSLSFTWFPLVKTYAFGTLLLFLAYSVLSWGPAGWRYFISGLLLGLAIDTRLYVLVVIPVFALAAFREVDRRTHLLRFTLGLTIALMPNLFILAIVDPGVFFFNVVGHHVIRSGRGMVGAYWQKGDVILHMLGVDGGNGATSIQYSLMMLVLTAVLVAVPRRLRRPPFALVIATILFVIGLVPTPTYSQYFCMFLPVLIVGLIELLADATAGARETALARPILRALLVVLAVYVLVAPLEVYRFVVTGDNVPGIFTKEAVEDWTIPAVTRVGRAIDAAMPAGGTTAISWWPGYFVETRAKVFPQLANPYAFYLSTRLSADEIAHYQFVSHEELSWHIAQHRVPVVVLGNWMFAIRPVYAALLAQSGYVSVAKVGHTEIYRWPGPRS